MHLNSHFEVIRFDLYLCIGILSGVPSDGNGVSVICTITIIPLHYADAPLVVITCFLTSLRLWSVPKALPQVSWMCKCPKSLLWFGCATLLHVLILRFFYEAYWLSNDDVTALIVALSTCKLHACISQPMFSILTVHIVEQVEWRYLNHMKCADVLIPSMPLPCTLCIVWSATFSEQFCCINLFIKVKR